MDILLVAATHFEIMPTLDFLEIKYEKNGMQHPHKKLKENTIHVLITGVGMVNTAYMMGKHSSAKYDLIINVGICGAVNKKLQLGDLVHITKDTLSEMGAEDGNDFIKYDALGLGGTHVYESSFDTKLDTNFAKKINTIQKVSGITVNTIHGNEESIDKVIKRYPIDVESMEGAAFFASCTHAKNYIQLRSISNYVEKRDKRKWNMPLAIKNLNDFLIQIIEM